MRGGIGIGLLSGAKNKKIVIIAGGVLMAIGIAGMIAIGSQASDILTAQGEFGSSDQARSYFYGEYIFLAMIVVGLVLAIFGAVSMQRKKSPAAQ